MVQGGVNLAVGGVDRVGPSWCHGGVRLTNQADQWTEKAQPELDQQHAEFESDWRQAIAASFADALDEAFRAELTGVVSKLAEAVPVRGEVMASNDAGVQL